MAHRDTCSQNTYTHAIFKRHQMTTNAGENVRKEEDLLTANGKISWVSLSESQHGGSKNQQHLTGELPYDPAMPFPVQLFTIHCS